MDKLKYCFTEIGNLFGMKVKVDYGLILKKGENFKLIMEEIKT